MTAEDNEPRDDESTEAEGSDHESEDDEGTQRTRSTEADDSGRHDGESDDDRSEERVKERDEYDDETPGVTDARPGRDDIGESQMPSDYHQAVADRPVEVKLPDTPDLSEDATGGDGSSSSGNDD